VVDDFRVPIGLRVEQFVAGDEQDGLDAGLGFFTQKTLQRSTGAVAVAQRTQKK
jgi:hypothetical protein